MQFLRQSLWRDKNAPLDAPIGDSVYTLTTSGTAPMSMSYNASAVLQH